MKYKFLVAAMALAVTDAHSLDGLVVNYAGDPLVGVNVEAISSKELVVTDSEGRFEFADDVDELHITAPGYSHKIVHLHDLDENNLVITLAASVIEQTDVIGLPIHASVIESALPVTVLSGDKLRQKQAATLGDSLEGQPGVATSSYGNVASTPVIRGLSGPRVLITQNSLDVSDVSRVGPDHSVAAEASTAQQVEILRGPATLFYGSGAIGGVVNVVDFRVPIDSETQGEFLASYDSVNSQKLGAFNATTGTDNWAVYADGFWRDSDDYETPVAAALEDEHEEEHEEESHSDEKTVANSDEETSGFTLGTSYLMNNGYVGVAVERLDREYGIPGHGHGDERVFAELEQDRYQLQSELVFDSGLIHSINTRAAYTDYTHTEFEDGAAGTTFDSETTELRFDVFHQEWDHWKGGINIQYKKNKFGAEGEEAFTPASTTESFAFAVMEERHFGDVLVQLGARAERVTVDADNVLLPALEVVGDDIADDHDHGEEVTRVFAVEHEFEPISASLGAVWDFTPGYNIGIAVSHAQRAPSAAELLSFGPHIGTGTYEIGALFELHDEDGESHFELSDAAIDLETSNNIDLTFRKHEGDYGLILNLFYNQVDNYYYQQATGLSTEFSHDHEEDEHDHDAEEESEEDLLPVYLYDFDDAEFYGLEAQVIWQVNTNWKATFLSDFVHAELNDGSSLPRTTPMRFGADLDFFQGPISANLSWMHYAEQDEVAELETTTDGYDMLDASISYRLPLANSDLNLFVKAQNLTDTEARVHTSFIKDLAPLPGRNFSVGIRGSF